MESIFIDLIGKEDESIEMNGILEKYNPVLVSEDHLPTRYYSFKDSGVEISSEFDQINGVFIYVEPKGDISDFKGELPGGIKRQMSQNQIHSLLGVPKSHRLDSSFYLIDGKIRFIITFNPDRNYTVEQIYIGSV